jgi:hypothetical protein
VDHLTEVTSQTNKIDYKVTPDKTYRLNKECYNSLFVRRPSE